MLTIFICFSFNTIEDIETKASWYGEPYHGRHTASGEIYNMNDYTAAHKTLKFGTKLEVTNLNNNKKVIVRINDRGPFVKNRGLDLSKQAFSDIANLKAGVIKISYKIIE